ncbi:hypothetical protein E4U45_000216, partial [Claviceps purpurea]
AHFRYCPGMWHDGRAGQPIRPSPLTAAEEGTILSHEHKETMIKYDIEDDWPLMDAHGLLRLLYRDHALLTLRPR